MNAKDIASAFAGAVLLPFLMLLAAPVHFARRARAWWWVARAAYRFRCETLRRQRALDAANFERAWDRADKRERNAEGLMVLVCVIALGLLIAVVAAGCGGVYPLEPSPDAGADTGPTLPPCAAPAGYVVIAHGCDCASDPAASSCSTETTQGDDPRPLVGCRIENGERCVADCGACAP